MNEVVKHHNDLNQIYPKGWKKSDMDLFCSILCKVKGKGEETVKIGRDELIRLNEKFAYPRNNEKAIRETLLRINSLSYIDSQKIKDGYKLTAFHLFSKLEYTYLPEDGKNELLVTLDKQFHYILNDFTKEFTYYELAEFLSINSIYAKQAYKKIKQWKTVGITEPIEIDDFRALMGLSMDYPTKELTRRVIKVILDELRAFYPDLTVLYKYNVSYDKKGNPKKGQKITHICFVFTPEKTGLWIPGKPQNKPDRSKKNEQVKPKAPMPEWYYKEDPGTMDPELLEQIRQLQAATFDNDGHMKKADPVSQMDDDLGDEDLPW